VSYKVPKESLTVRYQDGSYADVPLSSCSCGGKPCGDADAVCAGGNGAASAEQSQAAAPATETVATPGGSDAGGGEAQSSGVAASEVGETERPCGEAQPASEASQARPAEIPAADGDSEYSGAEGPELVIACETPAWTAEAAADATGDLDSVEDPPGEPPLGVAETVVESDSVPEGAGVEEISQPRTADEARASGEAPSDGSAPRRNPRRRRRRRPKSGGGGGVGGDSRPSSPH
jgi:hypothetical protein